MEFGKIDFLRVPICNYILIEKRYKSIFVCVQNLVVLCAYITEICGLPVKYFYIYRILNECK